MNDVQYMYSASIFAMRRAEYWRRQIGRPGSVNEARAELRHHIVCREQARIIAMEMAKAAES